MAYREGERRLLLPSMFVIPMRRTFLIACLAHLGDKENLDQHKQALEDISPDFVPSLLRGEVTLFRLPEHNELLIGGLLKAGYAPPG